MGDTIMAATEWKNNAHLIADVAKLGYLDGAVIDVTYGKGNFWNEFRPETLTGCDLEEAKSPLGRSVDFTDLEGSGIFGPWDVVVLDPPYKLNGTPTQEVDEAYGVHITTRWQDRMQLIHDGIAECARIVKPKGYLLLKCMDQVCSGKKVWQTYEFTTTAMSHGLRLADRFDMLTTPRPQPGRQVHTRSNYSTLLVFQQGRL